LTPRCCVPACTRPVVTLRRRLCQTHYNRAKDRRRNSHGTLAWATLLANPTLLNGERTRLEQIIQAPQPQTFQADDLRSCLLCSNCKPVPPRTIACTKNQWGTIKLLSLASVERGGIPTPLVGRAKTCPSFSHKP
jgi:hypothetical protein